MNPMTKNTSPSIRWDIGTAYELFASLHVIYEAEYFGIRASWAAGVRSRIPAAERKIMEEFFSIAGVPLKWLSSLPAPKDAVTALLTMRQIPARERITQIYSVREYANCTDEKMASHAEASQVLLQIASTGKWTQKDVQLFFSMWNKKDKTIKKEKVERYLDWCSKPEELGEGFLNMMQAYYQAFFEEEEKRVIPVLKEALSRAQELAKKLSFANLLSELSQGVQLAAEFKAEEIIIAPCYWITPLVFFDMFDGQTNLLLFGARPATMSVIPGENIPNGLVRTLKSLGDPTRLKILNYLTHEELTPSELARRLKLRAPTITHHLSELRLSGLVNLTFVGQEKRYSMREEAVDGMCETLKEFMKTRQDS